MRDMIVTYKGLPKEVYILFISKIITCIGSFVHPLMTLILIEKVGLTTSEAGGFISSLIVLQGPSIIIGGQCADRLGRKKSIILFQGLGIVFFTICGLLKPTINLAYCMIIASSMFAAAAPALDALNADITTEENRKTSYSLIYLGVNLGFAIGPALGGFLYKDYLNLIFIGDAVTTLLALLLVVKFVKEPDRELLKKEEKIEVDSGKSTISILLERPYILVFAIAMLIFQFGYSQFGFIVPLQLNSLFLENGVQYFGMLCAMNALWVVVLTPIIVVWTKKRAAVTLMAIGGFLYGVSFIIFKGSSLVIGFIIAITILSIGEIFIATNSSTFVANNTPVAYRGRVSGVLPLIYGVGSAIGPVIVGRMLENTSFEIVWAFVAFIVFSGALIMYVNKIVLKKYNVNKGIEDKNEIIEMESIK